MTEQGDGLVRFTAADHARNAGRALVLALPYAGPPLERLLFGMADEVRWRRLESVLADFSAHLKKEQAPPPESEEFATMFERLIPSLSREASPDRRARFRDLLIRAAALPSDSAEWAEADLAATLLIETSAPGLTIIAAIARTQFAQPSLVSLPSPQIVDEPWFVWDRPVLGDERISYGWPIVEEWARRLKERRLLTYSSHDQRGGFGRISLTSLGNHLVHWTLSSHD